MNDQQGYIRDIAEIRSMMERSTKFLSLSGWAGILAGVYALIGVYLAYFYFHFNPDDSPYDIGADGLYRNLMNVITLAFLILLLAIGTAVYFSWKNSKKRSEKLWTATTRRLLSHIAVPFIVGGVLILILISKGLIGYAAPLSLIFYGLALYNASKFTMDEVRVLGLAEIILGLISCLYISYGLIFWAIGFGIVHIIYGIYMHYKYER